jgi:hypothetical protein
MKKTAWFPSHTKPARIGWYESHWLIGAWSKLRYWDGEKWMLDGKQCDKQDYVWRGLTKPAK